uniref:Uncharacterized protein n=1 Tax=Junco hyemalis TaxID=40217 RepID=A0A8C5IJ14_JUNHY
MQVVQVVQVQGGVVPPLVTHWGAHDSTPPAAPPKSHFGSSFLTCSPEGSVRFGVLLCPPLLHLGQIPSPVSAGRGEFKGISAGICRGEHLDTCGGSTLCFQWDLSYRCLQVVTGLFSELQMCSGGYRCLQVVIGIFRWLWLSPGSYSCIQGVTGVFRWLQVSSGGYRCLQVITGVFRCLQVCSDGYRCIQEVTVSLDGYRYLQVVTDDFKWFQVSPGVFRWLQMSLGGYKCISGVTGVFKWFQVSPGVSGVSRWSHPCPCRHPQDKLLPKLFFPVPSTRRAESPVQPVGVAHTCDTYGCPTHLWVSPHLFHLWVSHTCVTCECPIHLWVSHTPVGVPTRVTPVPRQPKGADRKQKTDREKMEKRTPHEKEKYQPSYETTILTEVSSPAHLPHLAAGSRAVLLPDPSSRCSYLPGRTGADEVLCTCRRALGTLLT